MLEKIGLPPKPSLRGNTWVVDASHCQGCSSPFSFINRKHHCRRCGGIFCNSCTQQRMVLRGQGDSPVRICEPCKKLEEAARFEMRYGHKNKAAKGGSKLTSMKEDEILNQILGSEGKILSSNERGSASCSNISHIDTQVERGDIVGNLSIEAESITPEELWQQALDEKKKYRTLKAEGKSEEALKAFKRGKELERQAGALEISLRKSRKKALSSTNLDDLEKSKLSSKKSKQNDDLSDELKELGWSDLDLRDAEKKPATLTLEGELSSLIREVSQKPNNNKEKQAVNTNRDQVLALKKKALELKRAGNLSEAKEELKRAKILEKKIEEEELLGEADDSDDELSSLIRSMDADENDDMPSKYKSDLNLDFDQFLGIADNLGVDGNLEVTDEDLEDPEISSALKSLGWDEDAEDFDRQMASSNRESLLAGIKSLKTEAVMQKRKGNSTEAMALLKKAKLLEVELEDSGKVQKGSTSQSVEERLVFVGENAENTDSGPKLAPKSKFTVQKELLALKKKALTLRREGRLDESEEELRKAKVLEQQLEDMNKAPPTVARPSGKKQSMYTTTLGDGDEEEVTEQDLHDPAYLSMLKNLGWEDEQNVEVQSKENDSSSKHTGESPIFSHSTIVNVEAGASRKSKSEIQRELLALKRKALTLRRQGEAEEADEVLKMAKLLEAQLQEYEELSQKNVLFENGKGSTSFDALPNTGSSLPVDLHETGILDSNKVKVEKPVDIIHVQENEKPSIPESSSSKATAQPHSSSLQRDILAHKRRAVTLKREGKLAEAKEELRQAKLLEKRMADNASQTGTNSSDDVSSVDKKEASPSSVSKPMSSRDRFKLQQESLGHKRQALKLRREGKTAEADAEFELAKALESQLQELESTEASKSAEPVDDVSVEDFLDPQLLFALQSIGLEAASTQQEKPDLAKSSANNTEDIKIEKEQLAERIKAEKVKAVNLKRSGKQAEALDALRRAKLYEKKLQSLT